MKLLLARHGNTFSPDMTPVFVGSKQDMPLVEEGFRQAERFADFVKREKLSISEIHCGPLQRTRQFADTLIRSLKLPIKTNIESRLDEIDYGSWNGLSNDEIKAKFGEKALHDWNDRCVWPAGAGWAPSEAELEQQTAALVQELLKKNTDNKCNLLVTSNGRLRYFLKLAPKAFARALEQKSMKVLPGNACLLTFANGNIEVEYWNHSPSKALQTSNF